MKLAITGGLATAALTAEAACSAVPREQEPHGETTAEASPSTAPGATQWVMHATQCGRNVAEENQFPGSRAWAVGAASRTTPANDVTGPIQAYASATSVNIGETVTFHVSKRTASPFVVDIWRAGWYGGALARHMATSSPLRATVGPAPAIDAETRGVSVAWAVGASFDVPAHFLPGVYYATFTTRGFRHTVPFVVRDDARLADLCVVLPVTTYQAYNLWPRDGATGTSLYRGYTPDGKLNGDKGVRGYRVSFDRPYSADGMPYLHDQDQYFIYWAERHGYDLAYATSLDVNATDFFPGRYKALVFPGHDEYWSDAMRASLAEAITSGIGVAFLGSNNVYWRIRFNAAQAGGPYRSFDCYKNAKDPRASLSGATVQWRDYGGRGNHAEQATLGTQYVGICKHDSPLVVANADHWAWAGTTVRNGDVFNQLVGIEADGVTPDTPTVTGGTWTLLSDSPFETKETDQDNRPVFQTQRTSVWETPHGGIVFNAGTMRWTRALSAAGHIEPKIQQVTANILQRMISS